MIYLVQHDPNRTPVGVWGSFTDSYYPTIYASRKAWGQGVIRSNRTQSFIEFATDLSESAPSPRGSWSIVDAGDTGTLSDVYRFVSP